MNKYKLVALSILFLAFVLDVFTYLFFLSPSANASQEANPLKVLFGEEVMLLIVIPISLFVVFFVNWILDKRVKTNFERNIVYLFLANIVFAKVIASIANVMVAYSDPVPVQPAAFLLTAYLLTMVIIFVSPLIFNLGFYYLSHKQETEKK